MFSITRLLSFLKTCAGKLSLCVHFVSLFLIALAAAAAAAVKATFTNYESPYSLFTFFFTFLLTDRLRTSCIRCNVYEMKLKGKENKPRLGTFSRETLASIITWQKCHHFFLAHTFIPFLVPRGNWH